MTRDLYLSFAAVCKYPKISILRLNININLVKRNTTSKEPKEIAKGKGKSDKYEHPMFKPVEKKGLLYMSVNERLQYTEQKLKAKKKQTKASTINKV